MVGESRRNSAQYSNGVYSYTPLNILLPSLSPSLPRIPQRKYDVDDSDKLKMLQTGAGIRKNGVGGKKEEVVAKALTIAEKQRAVLAKKKGQKSIMGMFARASSSKKKAKTS